MGVVEVAAIEFVFYAMLVVLYANPTLFVLYAKPMLVGW